VGAVQVLGHDGAIRGKFLVDGGSLEIRGLDWLRGAIRLDAGKEKIGWLSVMSALDPEWARVSGERNGVRLISKREGDRD
jgi:hypothetical protein